MELQHATIGGRTIRYALTAQPYYSSGGTLTSLASPATATGSAGSFGVGGCEGWQQVWWSFSVDENLNSNEYFGVRVWNPGNAGEMSRLRVAYDVVDDFPATFTVPEK